MTKKIRVSIMGGTGYTSAELLKRLVKHPNVEISKIASIDHIGENVGKVHRNFRRKLPYTFENLSAQEVAKSSDLVFLTLPHKVSFTKVPELLETGVRIIDFSGDYRIQNVDLYNKYYKTTHTNPDNLKKFVYGMPEINRNLIKEANYVANPGCFATAIALSLLPLAKAGLLKNQKATIIGPTGSSGSGVHPGEGTHHPTRSRNLKSYKPLDHQHLPEVEQVLTQAGGQHFSLNFIPMSAPITRGILVNSVVEMPSNLNKADIDKVFFDCYGQEPFIDLCPSGNYPEIIHIADTNTAEIGYTMREEILGTKTLASICAIDNLVKGASGQAIHNMNLMFGLKEDTGLDEFGSWP